MAEEINDVAIAKVVCEIQDGLTGNREEDTVFLLKKMASYEGHEYEKEIAHFIFGLLKSFHDVDPEDPEDLCHLVAETDEYNSDHEYEKALETIEPIVRNMNHIILSGKYTHTDTTLYYSFNDLFEGVLFRVYLADDESQEILDADELPLAEIYRSYAETLMGLKRYKDAKNAFEDAERWNPVNTEILFGYVEALKKTGNTSEAFRIMTTMFRYAYTREDLARCYQTLGSYFMDEKQWSEAYACYEFSKNYDEDHEEADEKIKEIMKHEECKKLSKEEFDDLAKKYGFTIGAHPSTIGVALEMAKVASERGDLPTARYFLNIAYPLTGSEEVKEMLESFPGRECCSVKRLTKAESES